MIFHQEVRPAPALMVIFLSYLILNPVRVVTDVRPLDHPEEVLDTITRPGH